MNYQSRHTGCLYLKLNQCLSRCPIFPQKRGHMGGTLFKQKKKKIKKNKERIQKGEKRFTKSIFQIIVYALKVSFTYLKNI